MTVDECEHDRSKRQKITEEAGMELEDLVIEAELDRLQRYSDGSLGVQVKQNPDTYFDSIGFKVCKERQAVKKDMLQLGMYLSVHVVEVFSNIGKTYLVHRLGLAPGMALDLWARWDLNNPAHRAKVWSNPETERPILIVGSQIHSGVRTRATTHMKCMICVYRWHIAQGRFFVHVHSKNLTVNAELGAMRSVRMSHVYWWTERCTTISPK